MDHVYRLMYQYLPPVIILALFYVAIAACGHKDYRDFLNN